MREQRRIGDWTVDPPTGQLRANDVSHRVEPRVMGVLIALADRANEIWPREELLHHVWGDVAVTDDSLQRCISILRRTLGRGEKGVRIETIPKVGYRLVVDPATERTPTHPKVATVPPRRSRMIFGFAAAVVVTGGIISASWPDRPSQPDRPDHPRRGPLWSIRPLNTTVGHELSPTLSRDGSHVAFIRRQDGRQNLYVTVGDGPPLPLTKTETRAHAPAYAPDGRKIAFARPENGRAVVYTIAPTGGAPRRLFSCAHAETTELAWAPDGRKIAFIDRAAAAGPRVARIIDLETQQRSGPAPIPMGPGDGDLAFSLDGTALMFTRSVALGVEDLYAYTLTDGTLVRRTLENTKIHGLAALMDGRVLLSSNRGGPFGLWLLDREGRFERIPAFGRHHDAPTATRGQIVYEAWSARVDIVRLPADPKLWRIDTSRPAVVSSTHFDWQPAVGDDGRMAFISDRSGSAEVWWAAREGDEPHQLTSFGGPYVQGPRWSPDGRTLVFAAPVDGNYDIYTVSIDGGPAARLTESPARDRTPSFSEDGRAVYFASDRSGRYTIYRQDLATGRRQTLQAGYGPFEMDGWLYFTHARGNGLFRRALDDFGEATPSVEVVVPELTPVDGRNWTIIGNELVFVARPIPSKPRLVRMNLATGRRLSTTPLDQFYHHSGLAAGPKGRLFLSRVVSSETDLYRITWPTEDL